MNTNLKKTFISLIFTYLIYSLIGEMCVAKGNNGTYYRAKILCTNGDFAKLFYFDYGFNETVQMKNIYRPVKERGSFIYQIKCKIVKT